MRPAHRCVARSRAADQRDRVVDVERLGQVLERAALERGDRAVEVRVRRHDDDRHVRDSAPSPWSSSARPDSPGMRMSDTSTCGRASAERLHHLVRRGERLVRNALARERLLEHPANRAVVVDDPHGRARASPRAGSNS